MADEAARSLKGLESTMTYGQMRKYADNLDVHIGSAYLPQGKNGYYNEDEHTILIDRRLLYCQKRCTLVHELIHWQHADNTRTGIYGSRIEHRTRRETALKLIDPLEYRTAETMYEGDAYQIACELDVTLQVIQDYRAFLNGHCGTPLFTNSH
ncbi:MAG: ImmA/IrrE family metallo-endopeptidase [Bifidobacterium asteroides]